MILTIVPDGSLLLIPLGISPTWHSRPSVIGSFVLIGNPPRSGSSVERSQSLRRCRLHSLERRMQRVPSERGAFYAHRKFGNAGKHSELSEFGFVSIVRLAGDEAVEPLEEIFRVGP